MNSNSVWEFESFLLTSFRGAVVKQPMREYARGQRIAALPLHFHVFRRLFMCAQCTTKTGFNDLFCLMRVSHSAGSNSRIIKKSFFRSMTCVYEFLRIYFPYQTQTRASSVYKPCIKSLPRLLCV